MTDSSVAEPNNPSARLLAIMEKALTQEPNQSASEAWAKIFNCEPANTRAIVEGMSELFSVVKAARDAIIELVPGDKALYLKPLDRVEHMVTSYAFNTSWGGCRGQLDQATMIGLSFGKHALDNSYPAASAEVRNRVQDFISNIDDLLIQCVNSDLSDNLKKTFRKHLEAIRTALFDYLAGAHTDLDALTDSALGAALKHSHEIDNASDEDQSVVKKILESFSNVNSILSKGHEMVTLAGPIVEKLLPFLT